MNVYDELVSYLQSNETVEQIVFGRWWADPNIDKIKTVWALAQGEPNPPPVPYSARGRILTLKEAKPFMEGWSAWGRPSEPFCYAMYVWTNLRVIWIAEYLDSTGIESIPRHPDPTLLNIAPSSAH